MSLLRVAGCEERFVTRRSCSKTTGQYHSTKGNVVEMIGNVTGAESWQTSGREEHAQGETEYKAAQAKGYAEGTMDRLGGKKDAVVGAISGDREQEVSGESCSISSPRPFFLLILSANATGSGRQRSSR